MKYSKSDAKRVAHTRGWSQKLGYSKRELGIETPKNNKKRNELRRNARKTGTQKAWSKFRSIMRELFKKI